MELSYITAFNKQIKKSFANAKGDKSIEIIEKYKSRFKCRDYYQTFDSLTHALGFSMGVDKIFNEDTEKVTGFMPRVIFHSVNIFNNPVGKKHLMSFYSPCKSLDDGYKYLAKEVFDLFTQANNIEGFLKQKNIH